MRSKSLWFRDSFWSVIDAEAAEYDRQIVSQYQSEATLTRAKRCSCLARSKIAGTCQQDRETEAGETAEASAAVVGALRTRYWLVIEGGRVDLCQVDPGFEVDLYVECSLPTMTMIWMA